MVWGLIPLPLPLQNLVWMVLFATTSCMDPDPTFHTDESGILMIQIVKSFNK